MIMGATCILSFAQDFLCNEDYIYGMGLSSSEEEASDAAMLALSRTIRTFVVNETEQCVEEENGAIDESYKKKVALLSSIRIYGARKYETFSEGIYTVYYYLNRREYVNNRLDECKKYIAMANHYEQMKDAHRMNLLLGSLYHAYEAVNTDVMAALYPDTESIKEHLLARMRENSTVKKNNLQASKTTHYSCTVSECNGKEVPDFEYVNRAGEFRKPLERVKRYTNGQFPLFYGEDPDIEDVLIDYVPEKNRLCSIHYRLLYEDVIEGEYIRLQVPEEFYFDGMYMSCL